MLNQNSKVQMKNKLSIKTKNAIKEAMKNKIPYVYAKKKNL